jgi:hypothetical protein
VGLGYDLVFPLGEFADIAGTGHNWSGFAEYPIDKQWGIQLMAGYMIVPVNEFSVAVQGRVITFDIKAIPVKGAVKYYIYDNFFLQGEAGVAFVKTATEFTNSYGDTDTESADFEAMFTAGGGVGGSFNLTDKSLLNLTGKYIFLDGGDISFDLNHFMIGAGLVLLIDL